MERRPWRLRKQYQGVYQNADDKITTRMALPSGVSVDSVKWLKQPRRYNEACQGMSLALIAIFNYNAGTTWTKQVLII